MKPKEKNRIFSTSTFDKLHHIAIICSNYEESKVFYTKFLGLKIIRETYREERNSYKLDLRLKDCYIELFSFNNAPKRTNGPEATGLRHLAFEVEDIEKTVNELVKLNVIVENIRIDEITGLKYTFFKDPDKLPIEIYEKKM